MTKTWMAVERLENWEVDRDSGFTQFGIPDHLEKRASDIEEGDLVIFYISSGVSCFSDLRRITSSKIGRLRAGGDYDQAFPFYINTESVIVLDRSKWVSIKALLSELSFTKNHRDWRQTMRNSFRVLSENDAKKIIRRIKSADNA